MVALYRHFDEKGQLLYVGTALDPVSRLKGHIAASHWAAAIRRIEVETYPDLATARTAEREAIKSEKPLHNIMHNKPSPSPKRRKTPSSLFYDWRMTMGFTQEQAAEALGRSRRQVQSYDTGAEAPPRVVRLAMFILEEHPELATYKFADGSEIPDEEVIHNPDVEDNYSQESTDRIARLREKLAAAKDGN